ncbi:MAG: glycerol-3-phosphate dehydrogenase/oxidase [Pirellulales bacterium]|nr:glycerol-3-phosphate dehydrogenase/oxidase [Pirellulales bacterium]
MAAEPLDVLVVGGGIVGAGIARDAALRGLRVGLVEQYDFASGTSSRSSRLLHGGLRYLAQGRIGLVREASLEKTILHRIAPHLAEPLPFVFPSYRGTPWPLWQLRIGVKIYDLLCNGRNLGRSESLGKAAVAAQVPGLLQEGLRGAVRYFDGLTNDARLVIDTLRSAANRGAMLQNYCRLERADREGDRWRCGVRDPRGGRERELECKCIVNAGGPWGDRLPHSRVQLRMTKGVHLVADRARLPIPSAVVLPEGKRILFAIPWRERVILGTTDTDYQGRIEEVVCEADDVNYILGVVNVVFPDARLAAQNLISTWAGLRPLVANWRGKPSDISRAHEIHETEPGWWDITGGKLTTYRLMAEQMVDRLANALGRKTPPCRTAAEPLLTPDQTAGLSGIAPPPLAREVVEHYCRREWARRLQDVMIRRTSWHHYRPDAPKTALQIADWMAELLGWDAERKAEELRDYWSVCYADRRNIVGDSPLAPAGTDSTQPDTGERR